MNPETKIEEVFTLTDTQRRGLKRRSLVTLRDLLYYFPARHIVLADIKEVRDLKKGDHALLFGKVKNLKTKKSYKSKIPMAEGTFYDDTGSVKVVWFNQPYIAKMLPENVLVKMEGKVSSRGEKLTITNPEYERVSTIPIKSGGSLFGETEEDAVFSIPVYRESRGLTSKWIYHAVSRLFRERVHEKLPDPLSETIRETYNLPALSSALIWMHTPQKERDNSTARKRFAFEEVFLIQIEKTRTRYEYEKEPSFIIDPDSKEVDAFVERFPFSFTRAQETAVDDILADLASPHAMSRLLEGDVGSGKTAVAATTAHAVATTRPKNQDFGNLQVAYMAPTEILAKQHFESFIEYFKHLPIQVGLITGSGCLKFPSKVNPEDHTHIARGQLLKWVENGEIPILIGTHALIQKAVTFKHLAYIIIDEQHRFGINQRQALAKKDNILPHLLSMTATPIPRTLALTIYGDLDLTLLDEMPKGRKEVKTVVIDPLHRKEMYENARQELEAGRQLYVICPRIDEPDPSKQNALYAKSVKEETRRLKKKIFPNYRVSMLHGKMKPKEKDGVMQKFSEHEIDILVATSVVEVGVNVPNATTIIIEGAERFGLAQLHQLRGRVMRSTHQSYCYLLTESTSKNTRDRLKALTQAKNGFELAEVDLKLRGPGELTGTAQSGLTDIGMEALKNLKMVEAARSAAQEIIKSDPELKNAPELKRAIRERHNDLHFE